MNFYPTALGICGWKNAGKTTLVEQLIFRLRDMDLRIAVIKSDAHGVEVDSPGKDSDRFYKAGADVVLQGPGEEMVHSHKADSPALEEALDRLTPEYDVILVEGHKGSPIPKVWLLRENETAAPEEAGNIVLTLPFGADRVESAMKFIKEWLPARWNKTPVFGCLLIGGKSNRMGTPKHLLKIEGRTWIEKAVEVLGQVTDQVVIAGEGERPEPVESITSIPDIPGVQGPISGILSAMRWNPDVSWLVAACDMPLISAKALEWLLSWRKPGVWAIMPDLTGMEGKIEPLLSYYDMRSKPIFETLAQGPRFSVKHVADHERTETPQPPAELRKAWKNVNSLKDLAQLMSQADGGE